MPNEVMNNQSRIYILLLGIALIAEIVCFTPDIYSQNTEIGISHSMDKIIIEDRGWVFGNYNICIGYKAGQYLTTESYCVIIGDNFSEVEGGDFLWAIDYSHKIFRSKIGHELMGYLKCYEDYPAIGGYEVLVESRKKLSDKIKEYLVKIDGLRITPCGEE